MLLPKYKVDQIICCMQVCADGKTLLDTLQMPVSSGSCNSLTAKADYTEGASHVLDVVHEVSCAYCTMNNIPKFTLS